MLCERWSEAGHTVAGIDLPLTDDAFASALDGADAAVLCIPAGALPETLHRLVPHMEDRKSVV